ncbi:MAG TPA: spore coat protein U domain-containing protein [Candidatus Acidoferrales bacterium]|nr:spore coat protein U domain-containing protein [Candidatus Acidoferrales bacterium]
MFFITPALRAMAGTGTFNVASSVTVSSACTYNGSPSLPFGAYDPIVTNHTTPSTATGTLSVTCPQTLAYALTAGPGLNSASASGSCATGTCTRAMSNTGNFLSYDIYTSAAHATVWNATNGISGSGDGATQSISVFGYIPPALAASAGIYTDTVTVTVTF